MATVKKWQEMTPKWIHVYWVDPWGRYYNNETLPDFRLRYSCESCDSYSLDHFLRVHKTQAIKHIPIPEECDGFKIEKVQIVHISR